MIRLGIQVFTFVFIGTGVILLGLSQRDKYTQHPGVTKPNNTEVIDLGVIHAFRTPQIVRIIPVGNYGTEPIRIKGSAVSCGCTIASIKKSELKPGEIVDLEVELGSTCNRGVQISCATYNFNDTNGFDANRSCGDQAILRCINEDEEPHRCK